MSDTVISARVHLPPTAPGAAAVAPPTRRFSEVFEVVEVLDAVETHFRQGETSILAIINSALSNDAMTRAQLLQLRARMRRYSREVSVLGDLIHSLAEHLRELKERG